MRKCRGTLTKCININLLIRLIIGTSYTHRSLISQGPTRSSTLTLLPLRKLKELLLLLLIVEKSLVRVSITTIILVALLRAKQRLFKAVIQGILELVDLRIHMPRAINNL